MKIFETLVLFCFIGIIIINASIIIPAKVKAHNIITSSITAKTCEGYISTKTFSGGENFKKEYWLYRCSLNSEFKSLLFYYDPQEKKVVKSEIFNMNYESLIMSSPYHCGYENMTVEGKTGRYEQCSLYTGRENLFWIFEMDSSFDTPPYYVGESDVSK